MGVERRRTVEARAYLEGNWWVFEIPDLGSPAPSGNGATTMPVGQTRTASKIVEEASALAALWVDGEPEDFEVTVKFVH